MESEFDSLVLIGWSARICCAGLFLQSLELASLWRELHDGHLLGWHGDGRGPHAVGRLLRKAQGFPTNLGILLYRASAAGACLWLPLSGGWVVFGLLVSLVVCQLYYNRRFQRVLTNADNMNLIVLAGVTVGAVPGASETLRNVALGFVAFQSLLAYGATGVDKLLSVNWRNGTRLIQVFQDSSHRFALLGQLFADRPFVAKYVSRSIIAGEVLFPICVLLPTEGLMIALAAGLVFHVAIGVIMGLPMFFWAFAATYPALYFAHQWIAMRGCQ